MCSRSKSNAVLHFGGANDMEFVMRNIIKWLELSSSNEAINV